MTSKTKRSLTLLLLAAVAIALVGWLMRPQSLRVDHVLIDRGLVEVTVDEQGKTRARYRYTVAAPVTGRLLRTQLDEGDSVNAGDALAQIAPAPEDARIETALRAQLAAAVAREDEAQAHVAEADSNLELATSEAQRRKDLYDKGMISVEVRDQYLRAADTARARHDSAAAALAAARADTASARARMMGTGAAAGSAGVTAVEAPVAGVVLRVLEESERVVAAGTPLFELSKGRELEIVIDFLTQDAVRVTAGDLIRISGWGGSENLQGTVRYVEPGAFTKISTLGVEEQRVNVLGDFIGSTSSLGAEFRIEAAIVIWSQPDALRIPTTAIFRRGDAWHAFVVEDGRARLRQVGIGQRGTDYAEVLTGVAIGDTVIQFPSDLVAEGVRVATSD